MNVIGLDLSLTATGVATEHTSFVLEPPRSASRGMERLRWIRDQVLAVAVRISGPPALVVIEGYSFSSRNSHAHALGELGGVVRLALVENGVRYVDVPPKCVKKYATGKGNAGKELVLVEAVKRLGYTGSSNDEADALWLRMMALDHYGLPGAVQVPQAHRAGLSGVGWPVIERAAVA